MVAGRTDLRASVPTVMCPQFRHSHVLTSFFFMRKLFGLNIASTSSARKRSSCCFSISATKAKLLCELRKTFILRCCCKLYIHIRPLIVFLPRRQYQKRITFRFFLKSGDNQWIRNIQLKGRIIRCGDTIDKYSVAVASSAVPFSPDNRHISDNRNELCPKWC